MSRPASPIVFAFLIFLRSAAASGQTAQRVSTPQETSPTPITAGERINWIVDGMLGPKSLGIGVLATTWQMSLDVPKEWQRNAYGIELRYLEREADVAISNSLEAGLGAIWGEDPRYFRASSTRPGARAMHAIKTVVLAPRADGQLKLAWGRFAGNVFNNVIENAWLPPSMTTPGQTALRSATGMLGRLAGNLWEEFWPDIRSHLTHRRHSPNE